MIKSGSYPVALSRDIAASTSSGVVLGGQEIVVWRDTGGRAQTWEDRCPHRGMKLSFGFVRGDHIACLYHGWQFNGEGRCQYVPAHPDLDVPKSICVKTYPVAEGAGFIWVWHGVAGQESVPAPDDTVATAVRSVFVDAGLDAVIAGLGVFGDVTLDGSVARIATPNDTLVVGLHVIDAHRTALHMTVARADVAPDALVAWAAAAETLRRTVEAGKVAA